ncbi:hypothetical protein FUA23_11190 [Neolewinella aurantiaca]|uniref:Outer membrane efflux protein n=1 Tax=Neolewinella aurantiaca TaxID=2602767 RepID=A0A5C7FHT3_9BACT|nr:hypothetical protein [Neolewinella aurantiaca]TXF89303.1 hypothetical protein FUA23_11190 [Neolewinella aurantiaca]
MRNLPLLLLSLLCTCGPAPSCQAQVPDTLITVTKLPYPEARIFAPPVREGLAPSRHEQSEHPHLSHLPSPEERGRGRGYESCIQTRHLRLREAELATLTKAHKKDWLKYIPSLNAGLSPALRRDQDGNFSSRLTPTLSLGINSSLIYQAHRNKQQRAATRESIIKRSQLKEDIEIAKLHRLQRRLEVETDKLNLHNGVADIDRQLFTLYQKQYENHDISPEEYLLKRKTFLLQELRNQDQITRIETLQYEIENLAGCLSNPQAHHPTTTKK